MQISAKGRPQKSKGVLMTEEKKKIILRNDVQKKRQQLNFSIDRELHLDIKDLHTMEQRKRGHRFNLKDFYEEILQKGVREWLSR